MAKTSGFRFKKFKSPPAKFNFLKATNEELARYGVPKRPDPEQEPSLHRIWMHMFSRNPKVIVPKLKSKKRVPSLVRRRPSSIGSGVTNHDYWSGSALSIDAADRTFPYVMYGFWQVPAVTVPKNGTDSNYSSVMWIGIDGWGGPDLCQAGTGQNISSSGQTSYFAWFEWYEQASPSTTGWQVFSNFPISPHDFVSCLLMAITATDVFVFMFNQTKNTVALVGLNPPKTFSGLTGLSAEWILERPSYQVKGVSTLSTLPSYSQTFFAEGTLVNGSKSFSINDGTLLQMTEGTNVVSTPTWNGILLTSA